jgi:LDH2 family malate/lactate/ureidoglycolate dehydrogenase
MELAMMKAAKAGIASVAAHNINHIGRLGEYVEQAADAGFLSMALSGWGGRGTGFGAPYGGSTSGLSTNPIAFGVPTSDGRPLTSDFATTRLANAKVHVYALEEKELPPDCVLDKDGNPSTDPADYIDGGTLLVFGGHKGSAISMMTCLLGGLAAVPDPDSHVMGGDFFMALDPRVFPGGDAYLDHAARFLDGIRSTPPAPGFEEVLAPGDLERRAFETRSVDGIDLPMDIWTGLTEAAAKYGVKLENDANRTLAQTVA